MQVDPLEIMISLVKMYDDGKLASEYDKDSNRMINSKEVTALATAARVFMPPRLQGDEAAKAMRALPEDQVNEAIETSGSKVIDLRDEFREKIRLNNGAQGLLRDIIAALDRGERPEDKIALAKELVDG